MSADWVVITGASGNIGSRIAHQLLAAGQKVRAIGRSAERLKALADKGAEIFVGTVEDAGAMTEAFSQARSAFLMIPPNHAAEQFRAYQHKVSESYLSALTGSTLTHVVNLSSIGAELGRGAGPIDGLHDHEQRLNKLSDINLLHLRPAFFMENLYFGIALIKQMGANGGANNPEVSLPMVATEDIAWEAAERLTRLDFQGHSIKELLGPRDVSMTEASRIVGAAIGKPDLRYVQFTYEDAEKAMTGMGMSKDVAHQMIELTQSLNEGRIKSTQGRSGETSTRTALEDFAKSFAVVYNQSN